MSTYGILLNDLNSLADQPSKLLKDLKPHQRTALFKSIQMETQPFISYDVPEPESIIPMYPGYQGNVFTFRGQFQTYSNMGVIGDIVGYGKTLIALGILASVPLKDIYVHPNTYYSYHIQGSSSYMMIQQERQLENQLSHLIQTTLIVVPKGPVYVQWKKTIEKETTLKCLFIDSLFVYRKFPSNETELKTYLESYDCILIKQTTLKDWVSFLRLLEVSVKIEGFERMMVDEAHDILTSIPLFHFKFLWMITSNYMDILQTYRRGTLLSMYKHLSMINREKLHYMLVKNETSFVMKSFDLPKPTERIYLCGMDKTLSILTGFVSPSIQEKINVNDIAGAIHEMGGTQETEHSLLDSIRKEFVRNIENKEKEALFLEGLDLEPEIREQRLRTVHQELTRLKTRQESLEEQLKQLNEKTCPICMDELDNPLYLNCTHTVCGKCLFQWVNSSLHTRSSTIKCPECRTPIDSRKIIAIVKQDTPLPAVLLSKEDQLMEILTQKPNGRFLIFSRLDSQFYKLYQRLSEKGIRYGEMKGHTSHMMNVLNDFNAGYIQVILLNTHYAGYGIDMSQATDVILYHSMPSDKSQAIGRAQRVGRTTPLTVHHLCYSQEMMV